jgi:hypothetical protein
MSKVKKSAQPIGATNANPEPTRSRLDSKEQAKAVAPLLLGKKNYYIILAGLGLITIGMFLMSGGKMPSRDVWDENLIYSTRRTLIAPIFILSGLAIQVYAIFAKKD